MAGPLGPPSTGLLILPVTWGTLRSPSSHTAPLLIALTAGEFHSFLTEVASLRLLLTLLLLPHPSSHFFIRQIFTSPSHATDNPTLRKLALWWPCLPVPSKWSLSHPHTHYYLFQLCLSFKTHFFLCKFFPQTTLNLPLPRIYPMHSPR